MLKIGFFDNIKRSIKSIFNSNYKLIDIENRIYDGKEYTSEKDGFFIMAYNLQKKEGYTQTRAVKELHESFRLKNAIDNEKLLDAEQIYKDWIDSDIDLDVGYEFIIENDGTPTGLG